MGLMKKLSLYIFLVLMFCNFGFAQNYEVISKNPGKIKRGAFGKPYKTKVKGKHTYNIIKDPTGNAPTKLVERFELRGREDCAKTIFEKGYDYTTDCMSGRTRIEITQNSKYHIKKTRLKKKDKEMWYGWYIYFPKDYVSMDKLSPYLGQFLQKKFGGGGGPFPSCAEVREKLVCRGEILVSEKDLRGKWHKIEFNILWSIKNSGFVKIYYNDELKISDTNFSTLFSDKVMFKYGIYRVKDWVVNYGSDFVLQKQVVYYSGVRVSSTREGLKIK